MIEQVIAAVSTYYMNRSIAEGELLPKMYFYELENGVLGHVRNINHIDARVNEISFLFETWLENRRVKVKRVESENIPELFLDFNNRIDVVTNEIQEYFKSCIDSRVYFFEFDDGRIGNARDFGTAKHICKNGSIILEALMEDRLVINVKGIFMKPRSVQ